MSEDAGEWGTHPIADQINREAMQAPSTRRSLIGEIETLLGGRRVVTYFTSFEHQVIIDKADADMLESVIAPLDLSPGLTLMLNSPGGDALAAEQIIQICRTYSGGNFEVLVPKAAKSAATMIALGAQKIVMGATAELGPIDPQVRRPGGFMPAHAVIQGYDKLLANAVAAGPDARIEPYLQQLSTFDPSELELLRKLRDLSDDIAFHTLKAGMLSGKTDAEIRFCVERFTDWDATMAHGRSIFPQAAIEAGLVIDVIDHTSPCWEKVFEYYMRANGFVSSIAAKTIETTHHAVSAGVA